MLTLIFYTADLREFRLDHTFDIIYSSGVLHYLPPDIRNDVLRDYQTSPPKNGIHALNVFVG